MIFSNVKMSLTFRASSRIWPRFVLRNVYYENLGTQCFISFKVGWGLLGLYTSLIFSRVIYAMTLLLKSRSSSNCIILQLFWCGSSRFTVGFLHKLYVKVLVLKLWPYDAKLPWDWGFRCLRIPFHEQGQRFFFSCQILTSVMDVRRCGWLVMICVPNLATNMS